VTGSPASATRAAPASTPLAATRRGAHPEYRVAEEAAVEEARGPDRGGVRVPDGGGARGRPARPQRRRTHTRDRRTRGDEHMGGRREGRKRGERGRRAGGGSKGGGAPAGGRSPAMVGWQGGDDGERARGGR
jgi:hypothetical protein